MTTPSSPDGQDGGTGNGTADAGTSNGAPQGQPPEPVRNWADAQRAFAQRDQFKGELKTARDTIAELQGRLREVDSAEATRQLDSTRAELTTSQARVAELEAEIAKRDRASLRSQAVDAALKGVHPDRREHAELLLSGLAANGEVALETENPTEAGAAAREKLAGKFPDLFAPSGAPAAGAPAVGEPGFGNVQVPTDLTPEEMASLTPEEFDKLFGRGRDRWTGV